VQKTPPGNNDLQNGHKTNNDLQNGHKSNNDLQNGHKTNYDLQNGTKLSMVHIALHKKLKIEVYKVGFQIVWIGETHRAHIDI
jgi:hypothetical protein